MRWRLAETSKKAPHELNALLEPGVAMLEVFDEVSHVTYPKVDAQKSKMQGAAVAPSLPLKKFAGFNHASFASSAAPQHLQSKNGDN